MADITYCCQWWCANKDCERHYDNAPKEDKFISTATFMECEYWIGAKVPQKERTKWNV